MAESSDGTMGYGRRMPYASVNGQQLFYDDTGGDGPPVILSHGFLMDNEMFEPQVAALRDSYRALILLDTEAGLEDPEMVAGLTEMKNTWLAVGPVPELAGVIAGMIIDEPEINEVWITKWQACDQSPMELPFDCLMSRDDLSDRLGDIACPALVIHGTGDTTISMDRAHALAAGLPGTGAVVEVAGAHAANLTNPGPVNEAIVDFLDGLAP